MRGDGRRLTDEMLARIDAVVSGHEGQHEYPSEYRRPLIPDRFTLFDVPAAFVVLARRFTEFNERLVASVQTTLDIFAALTAAINRRKPVPFKHNKRRYGR